MKQPLCYGETYTPFVLARMYLLWLDTADLNYWTTVVGLTELRDEALHIPSMFA